MPDTACPDKSIEELIGTVTLIRLGPPGYVIIGITRPIQNFIDSARLHIQLICHLLHFPGLAGIQRHPGLIDDIGCDQNHQLGIDTVDRTVRKQEANAREVTENRNTFSCLAGRALD